jgi:hypothetical protein
MSLSLLGLTSSQAISLHKWAGAQASSPLSAGLAAASLCGRQASCLSFRRNGGQDARLPHSQDGRAPSRRDFANRDFNPATADFLTKKKRDKHLAAPVTFALRQNIQKENSQ